MGEREVLYAIRRSDGEDMGDYSFFVTGSATDWQAAENDAEEAEEPVEYELVTFTVASVEKRTFGPQHPVCDAWQGTPTPDRSWVNVMLPTDGTEQTWPARDVSVAMLDTQEEADAYLASLPERFHLHTGHTTLIEVDRSRLTTKANGYGGFHPSCERCGHSFYAHSADSPR